MKKIFELARILSKKTYNKYIMISFMTTMFLMENNLFGKGYIKKIIPDFKMLDMNYLNTPGEITSYLVNIGELGRDKYLYLLSIDLVLIIVLCVLQSTLIRKLLKGIEKIDKYEWLIVLPFLRSGADFFETLSYMTLTKVFPSAPKILLYTGTIFTTVKWIFMAAIVIVIIGLLGLNIRNLIREKKHSILSRT
jgi:hypothetical protein